MGIFDDIYGEDATGITSHGLFDSLYGDEEEKKKKNSFLGTAVASTVAQAFNMPNALANLSDMIGTGINSVLPLNEHDQKLLEDLGLSGGAMSLPKKGMQAIDKLTHGVVSDVEQAANQTREELLGTDAPKALKVAAALTPVGLGMMIAGESPSDVGQALATSGAQTVAEFGPDAATFLQAGGKKLLKGLVKKPAGVDAAVDAAAAAADAVRLADVPVKDDWAALADDLTRQRETADEADRLQELELNKRLVEEKAQQERAALEYNLIDPNRLDQPILYDETAQRLASDEVEAKLAALEGPHNVEDFNLVPYGDVSPNIMDYEPNLRISRELFAPAEPSIPLDRRRWQDRPGSLNPEDYDPSLETEGIFLELPKERFDYQRTPAELAAQDAAFRQGEQNFVNHQIGLANLREISDDIIEDAVTHAEKTLDDIHSQSHFNEGQKLADDVAEHTLFGDKDPNALSAEVKKQSDADITHKQAKTSLIQKALDNLRNVADGTPETAVKVGDEIVKSVENAAGPAAQAASKAPKFVVDIDPINTLSGYADNLDFVDAQLSELTGLLQNKAKIEIEGKLGKLRKSGVGLPPEGEAAARVAAEKEIADIIDLNLRKIQSMAKDGAEALEMKKQLIIALAKKHKVDSVLFSPQYIEALSKGPAKVVASPARAWLTENNLLSKPLENMTYRELSELGPQLNYRRAPREVFDEVLGEIRKRVGTRRVEDFDEAVQGNIC